jgi:hypothetical protein
MWEVLGFRILLRELWSVSEKKGGSAAVFFFIDQNSVTYLGFFKVKVWSHADLGLPAVTNMASKRASMWILASWPFKKHHTVTSVRRNSQFSANSRSM